MKTSLRFLLIIILHSASFAQNDLSLLDSTAKQFKNIIHLTWEEVIDFSIKDNLSLKSKLLDYEAQNLEEWKAISSFLPTFSYQGLAVKNLELPVFIFMGQRFVVGTNYSFQHSLDLNLPLFTGGMRWFNLSAQKSMRKSLGEELKGKESQTVLTALQSFFGIMLSNEILKTAEEAVNVAKENLVQVEKFYNAGTSTELDLQRARAQYYSTLPQYEAASSNRLLSNQRLKTILNIPLEDSLFITDSLASKDFLGKYSLLSLEELKSIAVDKRNDLKSLEHLFDATDEGEKIALGQFTPTISVSANVTHQAQMDEANLSWSDYIRSKSIALSIYWPLFEGGKKIIDYQIAKIKTEQMEIALAQAMDGASLDVEEKYYSYQEAIKSLYSLEQAMEQSKESMRISSLMYNNGLSTQLDVLNAQLLYTKSKADFLQGIFSHNISQLQLLNALGVLHEIWK